MWRSRHARRTSRRRRVPRRRRARLDCVTSRIPLLTSRSRCGMCIPCKHRGPQLFVFVSTQYIVFQCSWFSSSADVQRVNVVLVCVSKQTIDHEIQLKSHFIVIFLSHDVGSWNPRHETCMFRVFSGKLALFCWSRVIVSSRRCSLCHVCFNHSRVYVEVFVFRFQEYLVIYMYVIHDCFSAVFRNYRIHV